MQGRSGAACVMGNGADGVLPVILLVGTVKGPVGAARVAFARLEAALARIMPDRVICDLFGNDGDAMMVAEVLAALEWRGRLTVVAPGLPNRRMVQQELQSIAPWIRVEVVAGL